MSTGISELFKGMGELQAWVLLPTAAGAALWDSALAKGANHKYIKRVNAGTNPKTGKPRYRYYYNVASGYGVHHEQHMVVGSAFKHGDGHYHITKMHEDGSVTVRHDESGHETQLSREKLSTMLHDEHGAQLARYRGRLKVRSKRSGIAGHSARARLKRFEKPGAKSAEAKPEAKPKTSADKNSAYDKADHDRLMAKMEAGVSREELEIIYRRGKSFGAGPGVRAAAAEAKRRLAPVGVTSADKAEGAKLAQEISTLDGRGQIQIIPGTDPNKARKLADIFRKIIAGVGGESTPGARLYVSAIKRLDAYVAQHKADDERGPDTHAYARDKNGKRMKREGADMIPASKIEGDSAAHGALAKKWDRKADAYERTGRGLEGTAAQKRAATVADFRAQAEDHRREAVKRGGAAGKPAEPKGAITREMEERARKADARSQARKSEREQQERARRERLRAAEDKGRKGPPELHRLVARSMGRRSDDKALIVTDEQLRALHGSHGVLTHAGKPYEVDPTFTPRPRSVADLSPSEFTNLREGNPIGLLTHEVDPKHDRTSQRMADHLKETRPARPARYQALSIAGQLEDIRNSSTKKRGVVMHLRINDKGDFDEQTINAFARPGTVPVKIRPEHTRDDLIKLAEEAHAKLTKEAAKPAEKTAAKPAEKPIAQAFAGKPGKASAGELTAESVGFGKQEERPRTAQQKAHDAVRFAKTGDIITVQGAQFEVRPGPNTEVHKIVRKVGHKKKELAMRITPSGLVSVHPAVRDGSMSPDLTKPAQWSAPAHSKDVTHTPKGGARANLAKRAPGELTADTPTPKAKPKTDADILAGHHKGDSDATQAMHSRAQELVPGIRRQDSDTVLAEHVHGGGIKPEFIQRMMRENRIAADRKADAQKKIDEYHAQGKPKPKHVSIAPDISAADRKKVAHRSHLASLQKMHETTAQDIRADAHNASGGAWGVGDWAARKVSDAIENPHSTTKLDHSDRPSALKARDAKLV